MSYNKIKYYPLLPSFPPNVLQGFGNLENSGSSVIQSRSSCGGRLYNYCEYANQLSAAEYASKVLEGELYDPVLSLELARGF